jgi:hypothetical protein
MAAKQSTGPLKREIIIDRISLGVMEFPAGTNVDAVVRKKLHRIFGDDFKKHTFQIGIPGGKRSVDAKQFEQRSKSKD